jgi:catechol 2,3-dioxygenase-like lactoylglutathione lyase family enzyme
MAIHHVSIVSLPVTNQDRSVAFFRDKLGFEVRREAPMGPNRWVEIAPPGAQTSITLVTWFEQMPPGSVQGLVLNTTDVDAVHSRLDKGGVKVSQVQTAPWGRHCTLKDPDGNGLVIVQENGQQ